MGNEENKIKLEENNSDNKDIEKLELDDISEIDIKGIELKRMPKEANGGKKVVKVTKQVMESFSGPLPHPKILREYNNICPGAADRILQLAEKQMEHRHDMEKTLIRSNSRNSFLGILFAFLLGLLIIGGGIYCVAIGRQVSGLIFGGAGLAAVIIAFIRGTRMAVGAPKSTEGS